MSEKHRGITAGTYRGNKIPKKTKHIFGWSGIFRDALYALVGYNFLNYAKTAGLLASGEAYNHQLTAIIVLYVLALVWDGFNDPIMGVIIERVRFKTGKFRPWILMGGIGTATIVPIMFLAKPHGWWFVACFGIFYFLWDFVFTVNDIAYWSMIPALSADEKERARLTTVVNLAAGIGQGIMSALPFLLASIGDLNTLYGYLSIPTSALFLLSQAAVFFLCKEKERDPEQEKLSSKTKFRELFTMVIKNKPLRASVIAIFFQYLLGAVTSAFLYDYLVITYGFGGNRAGFMMVIIGGFGVIGGGLAQLLFGFLSGKYRLMDIYRVAFYVSLGAYLAYFFLAAPIFGANPLAYSQIDASADLFTNIGHLFKGTGWIVVIPAIISQAGNSLFSLTIVVMMENSIEYHEYYLGERKEAVAFAWRPLCAKLSTGARWALYMLALFATGTNLIYDKINQETSRLASIQHTVDAATYAEESALSDAAVQKMVDDLSRSAKIEWTVWMFAIILACLVAAYLAIRLGYSLSDEEHARIVAELEKKHEKNLNASEDETTLKQAM